MPAQMIMVQGTASHVGKSVMAAAFCRMLLRRGYRVAPFKAQNMSNNSYVTPDGHEISRAQAVQAMACGLEPHVDMNPLLLKPGSDYSAQLVAMGKPAASRAQLGRADYKRKWMPVVCDALERLRQKYDYVVIEGAGSPAEVNLRERDLVNMAVARAFNVPVVLVGNIDWGGVFAQFVGTLALLPASERKLVRALLINQFRGNVGLLKPGLTWLEKKTGKKVLGVIPFFADVDLAEEDSVSAGDSARWTGDLKANVCLDALSGKGRDRRQLAVSPNKLLIDIIWLPRISNFTDFDPLLKREDVVVRYLHEPDRHRLPDLLILPGTKSTVDDLDYVKRSGLADYIRRTAFSGRTILGICGGYQMLGLKIRDPEKTESNRKEAPGLGLLPVHTLYHRQKKTVRVRGKHLESGKPVQGYEIHMGQTRLPSKARPFLEILNEDGSRRQEGLSFRLATENGNPADIYGTYLHGLFDEPAFLNYFIGQLRIKAGLKSIKVKNKSTVDLFDRVASRVEANMNQHLLNRLFTGKL